MTRVLVTGSNGQLGKTIQDLAPLYPGIHFQFTASSEADITDTKELEKVFKADNFDYCINCAAYTAVDQAEVDQVGAFNVNAVGVKNLAEACFKSGTILIHISTDFVFDGIKKTPYKTSDRPNPVNVYGKSKLRGEQYVQEVLSRYYIVRTSWVYSMYGKNFVKTMMKMAQAKPSLKVVADQTGSPTYAPHLAAFIIFLIEKSSLTFGLYHYSNRGGVSWYEFAKGIFKAAGVTIKVDAVGSDAYPTPARRPPYSVLDLSTIPDSLLYTWETGLEEYFKKQ